jgi:hypothetical protein
MYQPGMLAATGAPAFLGVLGLIGAVLIIGGAAMARFFRR